MLERRAYLRATAMVRCHLSLRQLSELRSYKKGARSSFEDVCERYFFKHFPVIHAVSWRS